jgi:NodT family efflux transporter outer membrane factor (OMF) lipoprotein
LTRKPALGLLAVLLAAGCTVGPDYAAPDMPVPPAFVEAQPVAGATVDPARWWEAFGDPQLDALVTRALADNPSMAIAASRVRQARLQEIAARGRGKPTIDATANVSHVHFSKNAGFSSLARRFGGGGGEDGPDSGIALPGDGITTYALGFDASWELDLFGGARRGVEAAEARTEAAVWNKRDAAVTLAAEVADAYFALRLDQAQVRIVEEELEHQRRALEIAAHTAEVGLVPDIDVTRQRGSITATEAWLEPLRADIRGRMHALAILTGQTPEALGEDLATEPGSLDVAPVVPPGLPSELLRRRPDIRMAERQLAAATADIGVAVADLYPRFNLTGVVELISSSLASLFEGDSLQATGAAATSFPLLDWGRRKATVGMRREDREQAYQTYKTTVLQALRDVEDQLARIAAERRRGAVLRRALADREASAHATRARYRTGFVAQDALLDAQTDVLKTREQIAESDARLRQDTAALFKALGGGWQATDAPDLPTETSPR